MDNKRINEALSEIAKREGITVDEVRREIQNSIDNARKSKNPQVQKEWAKFGKNPSIESVIDYLIKQMYKK